MSRGCPEPPRGRGHRRCRKGQQRAWRWRGSDPTSRPGPAAPALFLSWGRDGIASAPSPASPAPSPALGQPLVCPRPVPVPHPTSHTHVSQCPRLAAQGHDGPERDLQAGEDAHTDAEVCAPGGVLVGAMVQGHMVHVQAGADEHELKGRAGTSNMTPRHCLAPGSWPGWEPQGPSGLP